MAEGNAQEAEDSDDPSASLVEDATETSDTLAAKRERAPAEGAMAADIRSLSIDKDSRLGDLHLAIAEDKEVAKEHAQWWLPGMKEKGDTHTRTDPGAPLLVDGGGASVVCAGCGRAQSYFRTEIDRG